MLEDRLIANKIVSKLIADVFFTENSVVVIGSPFGMWFTATASRSDPISPTYRMESGECKVATHGHAGPGTRLRGRICKSIASYVGLLLNAITTVLAQLSP